MRSGGITMFSLFLTNPSSCEVDDILPYIKKLKLIFRIFGYLDTRFLVWFWFQFGCSDIEIQEPFGYLRVSVSNNSFWFRFDISFRFFCPGLVVVVTCSRLLEGECRLFCLEQQRVNEHYPRDLDNSCFNAVYWGHTHQNPRSISCMSE